MYMVSYSVSTRGRPRGWASWTASVGMSSDA